MNALVPHTRFSILTPNRQAAFLESLAQFGNVRLACRAATISPQTAFGTPQPSLFHSRRNSL